METQKIISISKIESNPNILSKGFSVKSKYKQFQNKSLTKKIIFCQQTPQNPNSSKLNSIIFPEEISEDLPVDSYEEKLTPKFKEDNQTTFREKFENVINQARESNNLEESESLESTYSSSTHLDIVTKQVVNQQFVKKILEDNYELQQQLTLKQEMIQNILKTNFKQVQQQTPPILANTQNANKTLKKPLLKINKEELMKIIPEKLQTAPVKSSQPQNSGQMTPCSYFQFKMNKQNDKNKVESPNNNPNVKINSAQFFKKRFPTEIFNLKVKPSKH